MANIFLSYAREDRERIEQLVERLEASGLTVFWDRNVPPGSSWREVLDKELTAASCVVVAWSKHSVASDWVLEEAEEGKSTRRLVPVSLEPIALPMGFRAIQTVDLSNWSGAREHVGLSGLVNALQQRLSPHLPGPGPGFMALEPELPMGAKRSLRPLVIAGIALGVLALGAVSWRELAVWRVRTTASSLASQPAASSSGPSWLNPPIASASSRESAAAASAPAPAASAIAEPGYRRVYFENFESLESVAPSVWPLGRKGDWKGQLSDHQFRLCNAAGTTASSFTSALSYTEGSAAPVDLSNSRITMTVLLEPPVAKYTAAGIMFRHSKDSYYAFALSAGHSVMFIQAQGEHVKILSTWTLDSVKDGDAVPLRVEGHGDELRLFVNAKRVDVVPDPGGSGQPGVFAMGNGCARFDDVSVALPVK